MESHDIDKLNQEAKEMKQDMFEETMLDNIISGEELQALLLKIHEDFMHEDLFIDNVDASILICRALKKEYETKIK